MRRAIVMSLVVGLMAGNAPNLVAGAVGHGPAATPALINRQLARTVPRLEAEAAVATTRSMARDVARAVRAVKHPRMVQFADSFVRLQALSEVALLNTHAERVEKLALLGVSAHAVGGNLEVATRFGSRVVRDVGPRSQVRNLSHHAPDGSRVDALTEGEEEWYDAEAYAEDALADIGGMMSEAESMVSDLESVQGSISAVCAVPDGAPAGNPCYEAIKTSIQGILGGIAAYAANVGNIQGALAAGRAEVTILMQNFNQGLIGLSSLSAGLVAAAQVLIGAVSMPWWASAAVVATIGFIAYEAWQCYNALDTDLIAEWT